MTEAPMISPSVKRGRWPTAVRQTIIIAAITVVLCEVGLRIFNQLYPLPFFYSNSFNRFRIKPHSSFYGFKVNSRGFHDVEFNVEKNADNFRIVGIGDSFAFGVVPYPFNYLTLIEEQLNVNGHRVELINMGIPAIGPREYLAILTHEALELKPDMVLLSFFVGNDFIEVPNGPRWHRYSYLATLARYLYDLNTKIVSFDPTGLAGYANYDDDASSFTDEFYIEYAGVLSAIFQKANSKYLEAALANTVRHLGTIKRICDLHGIPLAVVILPDEKQVDPILQRQVIAASGKGSDDFDFDLPNERLKDQLAKLQIDHIDLLHPFRDAATHTRLYRRNDTHWNIKGNALASDIILRHLESQLPPAAGR